MLSFDLKNLSAQWHEGGGESKDVVWYAPDFAWSCPGYLARVMPRILRVVRIGKPRRDAAFRGWYEAAANRAAALLCNVDSGSKPEF